MAGPPVRQLKRPEGTILCTASVSDELATSWMRAHADWFAGTAADVVRVATRIGDVVAKRERPAGWKGSLVRVGARELRTRRAFRLACELTASGVPTPEPLACLTDRTGHAPTCCLIARHVEATDPWGFLGLEPEAVLPQAISSIPNPHPPGTDADRPGCTSSPASGNDARTGEAVATQAERDALLAALATALAQLHGSGFRHRDLKGPNVLIRRDQAGPPVVLWTDLESLERPPAITEGVRIRDLGRLAVSFASARARDAGIRADAWPRLVRLYLGRVREELDEAEVARFLARTQRWAQRHITRNVARGRPIA